MTYFGQSYAGAVITNAATKASNVVGLVSVAAFATDLRDAQRGDSLKSNGRESVLPGSKLGQRQQSRSERDSL
jgi:hypothetical protein